MTRELRFDGRVAIITGAGGGLGRAYALLLASRGASIVVNDLGGTMHGEGAGHSAADRVVDEILATDGEAVANYDSVENGERIVQAALDHFGHVDILINNAGILRDTSFHKMTDEDWEKIYRVHLYGGYKMAHAVWPFMRDQGYGRIVNTSSAAGLYGNFGQVNYSSAKLGLLGMANALAVEGQKRNVLVNTIAPLAGSRLTETILPPEMIAALKPEYVAPLVAYLCHDSNTTTGEVFEVGAGWFSRLRWQRSRGAFLPIDQPPTPEEIAEQWSVIQDFSDPTYPETPTDSFAPVMENLMRAANAAPPAEANDDRKQPSPAGEGPLSAIGYQFKPATVTYTEKDLSLYALAVGAAVDPLDASELQFVYEMSRDGFKALPTYAVTFPFSLLWEIVSVPGLRFNPALLLHGEQYLEMKRPLPVNATVTNTAFISNIYDKGSGALVLLDVHTADERGEAIAFNQVSLFIRGMGGFGGERGPSSSVDALPDRAPDIVARQQTNENQALLYRLASGDFNPLHADPAFSSIGGFDRPILHGLCTFGFAGRAVLRHFAGNDPARFKSIRTRFTKHVFPGETLVTEMWAVKGDNGGSDRILFQTKAAERDEVVLANGVVELWDESQ